ncbi:MAG: DUF3303 domain-containing protein [Nitrososphaerales archaeon]
MFLIRHTHSPERCPGSKGAGAGKEFLKSLSEEEASKEGVKIIGSYIAPTEHTLVFIVDAENLRKVEGFTFDRLALVGETKITPVLTIKEVA